MLAHSCILVTVLESSVEILNVLFSDLHWCFDDREGNVQIKGMDNLQGIHSYFVLVYLSVLHLELIIVIKPQCTEQGHRGTGSPAGADAASVAVIESSPNHHTGHNYKAKTCHFPGYGANGRISYDWYAFYMMFLFASAVLAQLAVLL